MTSLGVDPRVLLAPAALALLGAGAALAGPPAGKPGIRAEVQINLCGDEHEIVHNLQLQPTGEPRTEAWYFESPDLGNHSRGAVFRLRMGNPTPELTLKVGHASAGKA